MDKFWELMKESVIVQATITTGLVGACIYLACIGREIPDIIGASTGLAMGYYFGAKNQLAIQKAGRSEK